MREKRFIAHVIHEKKVVNLIKETMIDNWNMSENKVKILFVCLGNICRSPMAEMIMKKMVKDARREEEFENKFGGYFG